VAVVAFAGCGKHAVVDFGEAQAIRPGMTYQTVAQMIGSPGHVRRPAEYIEGGLMPNPGEVVYVWTNPNGSNLTVAFRDGRVIGSASYDLKHTAF
jgi:hypothetical protein